MRLQRAEKYSTSQWHRYPKQECHKQTLIKNHKLLGCRNHVFEVYFLPVRDTVSLENRFDVSSLPCYLIFNISNFDILTSEDETTSSF